MTTKETLYRAIANVTTEGRELIGTALAFNVPSLVRDPGRPAYNESFAPGAFNETLRRRPEPRPLWWYHEYKSKPAAEPVGVVQFTTTPTHLAYRAIVSRTRRGDEMLELVKDGAARDVSIGFKTGREVKRNTPAGQLVVRTEVTLDELSLAPTGKGMHEAGKVLAVRAEAPADTRARFAAIHEQWEQQQAKEQRRYMQHRADLERIRERRSAL